MGMKTIYKKIDKSNYYVYVADHGFVDFDDTDPIGLVSQDYFGQSKWSITSYFSCLVEDTYAINDSYFSSIEAGRALVKAWENTMWFMDSADDKEHEDSFLPFSWPDVIKTN
jgi:hypothetical protein